VELNARFAGRDISEQLVLSPPASSTIISRVTVRWKRKRIEAYVEEGKVNKIQSMVGENQACTLRLMPCVSLSFLGI
jgi:50S ribosomal subunit-associated GTPase HflX